MWTETHGGKTRTRSDERQFECGKRRKKTMPKWFCSSVTCFAWFVHLLPLVFAQSNRHKHPFFPFYYGASCFFISAATSCHLPRVFCTAICRFLFRLVVLITVGWMQSPESTTTNGSFTGGNESRDSYEKRRRFCSFNGIDLCLNSAHIDSQARLEACTSTPITLLHLTKTKYTLNDMNQMWKKKYFGISLSFSLFCYFFYQSKQR